MGNVASASISCLGRCLRCCLSTNLCLRSELDSQELTLFLRLFRQITLTVDPYYGQAYSLQSYNGIYHKILKKQSLSPQDYPPRKELLNQLSRYGEGCGSQNIIGTKIVAIVEKSGFIETTFDLYLSHDFIVADLSQQFRKRQSILEDFSEREIRIIIKECCKGLLRLDLANYSSIRMDHIYFCSGGEIKIAHPKLFNYASNLQLIFLDHTTSQAQYIYLSPEELKALEKNNTVYFSWNSNSFSFGVVILALMNMNDLSYLYHYQSCEVDFDEIGRVIERCKERYSRDLIEIIEGLLQPWESRRLTFKDLLLRLEKYEITKTGIDLHVIDPNMNFLHSSRFNSKVLRSYNQQPNYVAAFIQPRISMGGEYARIDQDQERVSRFKVDSVIANQRIKYTTDHLKEESFDNYLGETRKVQELREKKTIREGKGIYRHSDGQTYIGQWHLGKMHGYGKLFYGDGQLRYEGEFKNDLFDGYGVEYSEVQIAERQQEIDEEYVKIYLGNWIKYEGYYQSDKKSGPGKIYFKNGVWKGNFSRGQPNGEGVYCSRESKKETKGRWQEGELIKR